MPAQKFALILMMIAFLLMSSLPLENTAQAAGFDRRSPEGRKPFDRKRAFEDFKQNHPEIVQMIHDLRQMQNEVRMLAHEYRNQASPEQQREIEARIRFLLEDILRQQHAITEKTLEQLAERYERLRARHHDNLERFDDIVEQRFNALMRLQ